jgi:hypothetical protein
MEYCGICVVRHKVALPFVQLTPENTDGTHKIAA